MPSRLAVALAATQAAASPGHALTAASTASSWLRSGFAQVSGRYADVILTMETRH